MNSTNKWRNFLLKEGISDVVYHSRTQEDRILDILKNDRFLTNGSFSKEVEGQFGGGKLYFLSTSRTPINNYTSDDPRGAIFKLDGKRLRDKYKGNTIDYYGSGRRSSKRAADPAGGYEGFEAEDRIILDDPYVENADEYIEEIHFGIPMFRLEEDFFTDGPERRPARVFQTSIDLVEEATKIAEQKGIPYYIHVGPETWPHVEVGKKKALRSFEELQQVLEEFPKDKIMPRAERMNYVSPSEIKGKGRSIDRLDLFTKMARSILEGKTYEQFIDLLFPPEKEPGEIYSGLHQRINVVGDMDADYEEYKQKAENDRRQHVSQLYRGIKRDPKGAFHLIRTELHNLEKSLEARPQVTEVGRLLKQTGTTTVIDLMNYLKKAIEENEK